ncbi:juvenile hormone acid O-methyltransferase-like isoform X2 [Haematobia irritans]
MLFKQFSSMIQWGSKGQDTFCDIGNGPGDFFVDHIFPVINGKCSKILLNDIDPEMLEYCQRNFHHVSDKFEYKKFDISSGDGLPLGVDGKFDHVTSMLVLHWVPDIRMSLENTFNLLRPQGGDCILVFFAFNTIFNACNDLTQRPKWNHYTKAEDKFLVPFQESNDPRKQFFDMMETVGFQNVKVEIKSSVYDYDSVEMLKDNMVSVCHALDFIPPSRHKEFMDELAVVLFKLATERLGSEFARANTVLSADVIVAYGQRLDVDKK